MTYEAFAEKITKSGIVTDPWLGGEPRFREEPVVLETAQARAMYRAAEEVAEVYNELCLVVADAPELLETFFALTPYQKAMWLASRPLWHGIARADVFVTDEGLQIAELNCDTPTGEAEAIVTGEIARESHAGCIDPNRDLARRFVDVAEALSQATVRAKRPKRAAIVYPTELPEDLSLVRLYKKSFEERGWDIVLGSPFNVTHDARGLSVFEQPCSLMLRHYKTDWWSERQGAWTDETVPDTEPLTGPLEAVLAAMLERDVCVVNPFGAVVPQNKRAMAFMWEHIHRFSRRSQEIIRRLVPATRRLEAVHKEQLLAQRADWVIKSDYGAEGDEVVVGKHATDEEWKECLAKARPHRWVAQRYFQAKENAQGETVNYGVFVLAGEAAGLYTRVQKGPTDETALSAACLVRET
jgi:glutathionylspermidine synthase